MEMAALALSVVGVGIAMLSWSESRKSRRAAEASAAAADESADAAQRSARIEADRRHDELAPLLRVEWTEVSRRVGVWNSGVRIFNERTIHYLEVQGELLPPPMERSPLLARSNPWLLSTLGRSPLPFPWVSFRRGERRASSFIQCGRMGCLEVDRSDSCSS